MLTKIKVDDIEKIKIYVNKNKKTLAQIKNETGADYIINGGFYNMASFTSSFGLVADGEIIKAPDDKFGFAFKGNQPIFSYGNNVNADDYITAYPLLVRHGKKQDLYNVADNYSHRGRSAIGITENNEFVMFCVDDTYGYNDFTMDELANEMIKANCDVAINLDGGGSSQCDFNGEKITSTRIVHNYVCVYLKNEESEPTMKKTKVAIDIGHVSNTANGNIAFGYNEHEYMEKIAHEMMKEFEPYLDRLDVKIFDEPENPSNNNELYSVINDINNWKADICISLHSNAFSDPTAKGYIIFAYNKQSKGYVLANYISEETMKIFPDMKDRGVEFYDLAMTRETFMPCVLAEHGFHTNREDVLRIINEYPKFAKANVLGILKYLGIKPVEKPIAPEKSELEKAREWVVSKGISDGTRPKENATREELWTMLYRALY